VKQRVSKIVIVLLSFAFLITSLVFFCYVALPPLMWRIIHTRLVKAELLDAAIDVRSCSWYGMELADVRINQGVRLTIDSLSIRYSPRSLRQKRVDQVQITGGTLYGQVRDGTLYLGDFTQSDSNQAPSAPLPFDLLRLAACQLSLDWDGRIVRIPCDGSISHVGGGQLEGLINLSLPGVALPIQFTYSMTSGTFTFSTEQKAIELQKLLTAWPVGMPAWPAVVPGPIDARLEGTIERNGLQLSATAAESGKDATGTLRLRLNKTEKETILRGTASGDGWRLKQFFATMPAEPSAATLPHQADLTWDFEGLLPKAVLQRCDAAGLDLSRLGALAMRGHLQAELPRATGKPWQNLDLIDLQVDLASGDITTRHPAMVVSALAGSLRVAGQYRKGHGSFRLLSDSQVAFDSAAVDGWTAGKTSLSLHAPQNQNTLETAFGPAWAITRVHLDATSDGTTIRAQKHPLMTRVDGVRLEIDGTSESASGRLAARSISCRQEAAGFSLALNNPLWVASSNDLAGTDSEVKTTFTVESAVVLDEAAVPIITLDRNTLKPVSCNYRVKEKEGTFHLQWPLQQSAVLEANGTVNFRDTLPAGSISFACNGLQIRDEQPLVKRLIDSTDFCFQGDLSVSGTVGVERGQLSPRITCKTSAAALSNRQYQLEATGINGSVTFTDFSPFTTPSNQRFQIRNLELGKVILHDGLVVFQIDKDPSTILIEGTQWGCLGGRIYSQALRIDPASPTVEATIFANNVDMEQLAKLALGESGTGAGNLYGMISARASKTDLSHFALGEGFLRSTTDSGFWKLQRRDVIGLIQSELENQLERALQQSVTASVKKDLMRGLLDFEYSRFNVDFTRQEKGILARITASGRSRNQQVPVEFEEIILDVPRFDEILRKVLIIKKAFSQHYEPVPVERSSP
jgi:hypothetical protein